MNRKTALILSTSGALVAAAVILGQQRGSQATTVQISTPNPTPIAPPRDECSSHPAPFTQAAAFDYGTLRASLSSQKILNHSTGEMFVAVDLSVKSIEARERPPMNLAIVIDRSGSMAGEKLEQAKRAAETFVDRLSAQDRVALVQYDDAAQVLLPSMNMDAPGRARARAAITGITDGGGTNLHDGLALGRDQIMTTPQPGAVSRVILLSDGQANAGVTDLPTLNGVASSAADRGARITTVGLGVDYNEELMESLAEHGRGHYYYVQQASELQAVFRGELDSLQATVARNAELRLQPACAGVEVLEVYGFNSQRAGSDFTVPMADMFGGDSRRIVARVRVPSGELGARNVLRVGLSYDDAIQGGRRSAETAVGVEVSSDSNAVELSANKEVITEVMKVQSANALREAVTAYQNGDVAGATAINRSWQDKARRQAAEYKLDAKDTGVIFQELESQADGFASYAPASDAGKAMIKGSKVKAREMSKKK